MAAKTPIQPPKPLDPTTPITKSNAVAAFVESIHDLGTELAAWRAFGAQVVEFLKAEGLNEKFGKWQTRRAKPQRR